MSEIRPDERAVASTLSYALTLSITTILLVGVLAGAGSLVDGQQDRAIESGLVVQGERLAADLMTVDRLSRTGSAERVEVRTDLPLRVAGENYRVEITEDGEGNDVIGLHSDAIDVTVDFTVERGIVAERLTGGAVTIEFNDGTGTIEVRNG